MRSYRIIHRRIGIFTVIFLLAFVVTGLMLQHSLFLNLNKTYIPITLAEWLYDVDVESAENYKVAKRWVSHCERFLYLDTTPIEGIEFSDMHGAVAIGNYIWVGGDDYIWMLSQQGEVIEEITTFARLPGTVTQIGIDQNQHLIVRGLYDNQWKYDEVMSQWQVYSANSVDWAEAIPAHQVPAQITQKILMHARNHLISWERMLVDLHSGRLFGLVGTIIVDISAILLAILSIVGLVLWRRIRH